ncbi:Rep [Tadarida brasiliensis associated cyclovirus 1]|uniref:Rep n=1 Tax=Tadarida brasiliensis associated cyclovirus 1 TaxID=2911957 RepID=UPI002481E56B|nr:Rep [Tadarida brasiliensis associated cyclovirus 1]UJO02085.1 Rep [Tadarida brasiliensis associated cyclovirus 1]
MSNPTLRRFCWTLNNYEEHDEYEIQDLLSSVCKFAIYGREVCPTTGTKHLQGFWGRAHIEKAKGNDQQNQKYCAKDNDFWSHGEPAAQGNRSDLEAVVSLIEGGERSIKAVAIQCPTAFIKFAKGIREYIRTAYKPDIREWKTKVHFYWGPPGTGKSRRALEEAKTYGGEIYYKPRGEWWDGYCGQENVIIDDFYGWIKYDELLKICDRYPYQVPVKFGYEYFISKRIWITSNVDVDRIYRFIGYDSTAIRRRIDVYELIE